MWYGKTSALMSLLLELSGQTTCSRTLLTEENMRKGGTSSPLFLPFAFRHQLCRNPHLPSPPNTWFPSAEDAAVVVPFDALANFVENRFLGQLFTARAQSRCARDTTSILYTKCQNQPKAEAGCSILINLYYVLSSVFLKEYFRICFPTPSFYRVPKKLDEA